MTYILLNSMSTAEDVFYLYERNSRCYHDCNEFSKLQKCEDYLNNDCYCYTKQIVYPFTIGDQYIPCDMKIKCYIRPGDECPICCEQILTKSSAFITNCGHHFHKSCLVKYLNIKWLSTKYISTARCPMCRCSLGHPDFVQRYRASYFSSNYENDNEFDKLEDFWISINYRIPLFCSNGYNHYLGIKNNCYCCQLYRKTGQVM